MGLGSFYRFFAKLWFKRRIQNILQQNCPAYYYPVSFRRACHATMKDAQPRLKKDTIFASRTFNFPPLKRSILLLSISSSICCPGGAKTNLISGEFLLVLSAFKEFLWYHLFEAIEACHRWNKKADVENGFCWGRLMVHFEAFRLLIWLYREHSL